VYPFPALIEKLDREFGKSSVQVAFNFLQLIGDTIDGTSFLVKMNNLFFGQAGLKPLIIIGKSQYFPPTEPGGVPLIQQEGQYDLALEVDANKDLISFFRYNPQISK
jgi:hypothetical protein